MVKSKDKKIRWDLINKDKIEEFYLAYYNDFKSQEADFQQKYTKELWDIDIITGRATLKHISIERFFAPEDYIPRALFTFDESLKEILVPYFYIIKPSISNKHPFSWQGIFGAKQRGNLSFLEPNNPSNSDIFRVLLSSGKIINFKGEDLGEGMAGQKEFILSNGDTSEYTKIEFETFSEQGKVIKAFIDTVVAKNAKIFDFKRKCWFVQSDVIEPLLKGIQVLIDQNTLLGYKILDKREIVEDFEDFFHHQEGLGALPAKTKEALLVEFSSMCLVSIIPDRPVWAVMKDMEIPKLKPIYRKLALAYHPDRNNGDGSKMAALNVVWSQLQEYIK